MQEEGIKLSPSKLQCGRRIRWGGVVIEAVGPLGEGQSNVYISPDEQKVSDFLDIQTPSSKKECKMIAGCAAKLKLLPGYAASIPGHYAALQPQHKISMVG